MLLLVVCLGFFIWNGTTWLLYTTAGSRPEPYELLNTITSNRGRQHHMRLITHHRVTKVRIMGRELAELKTGIKPLVYYSDRTGAFSRADYAEVRHATVLWAALLVVFSLLRLHQRGEERRMREERMADPR